VDIVDIEATACAHHADTIQYDTIRTHVDVERIYGRRPRPLPASCSHFTVLFLVKIPDNV